MWTKFDLGLGELGCASFWAEPVYEKLPNFMTSMNFTSHLLHVEIEDDRHVITRQIPLHELD
jgi:hypothetical protein